MVGLGLLSLALITLDVTTRLLQPLRTGLGILVSPIQYIAESPYWAADWTARNAATRRTLLRRIDQLTESNLLLLRSSQQAEALRAENNQMRELLGSKPRVDDPVLIAEIVSLTPTPGVRQVVIDKGSAYGVRVGHAVLGGRGLFGQVVETNPFNARVLMITDPSHGVPVEVVRSGQRGVVSGTGQADRLRTEGLPVTADIRVGDTLVASGLGGRFPYGYPVGEVLSVRPDPAHVFALVDVQPSSELSRARHILVVLNGNREEQS